jgi:hypothetical protein
MEIKKAAAICIEAACEETWALIISSTRVFW